MSLTEQRPADAYLKSHHIPYDLWLHQPTHTAMAEARVLHLPYDVVLKGVMLKAGEEYVLAIVPASRRIDFTAIRRLSGRHARLASEAELERDFPGYELGALPALPGLLGVRAYVDEDVFTHTTVALADGLRTESIVADPRQLYWGEDVFVGTITRDPLRDEVRWRFEGDSLTIPEKDYLG